MSYLNLVEAMGGPAISRTASQLGVAQHVANARSFVPVPHELEVGEGSFGEIKDMAARTEATLSRRKSPAGSAIPTS